MVMPGEGTAESEGLDNAETEFDAPPLDETEIAPDAESTESASTGDETETDDPLASLDADTLRKHPKIAELLEATTRDVEARKEESARQRIATERAQALGERHAADRQYQASDKFISDFETILRNADLDVDGRPVLNRDALKQLNGMNIRTGADIPVSEMASLMAETVGPDFKQTETERAAQMAAYSHFHQTLDVQPLFRHFLSVAQRALTERTRDSLRAEVRAEVVRDEAAKAEAAKAEQAAKARNGAGPTTVRGAPVRTGGPQNQFETATQKLASGSLAEQMAELQRLTA